MTLALTDARLFPAVDALNTILGATATSAAATLDITTANCALTVVGTTAYTLPNGTYTGQNFRVQCVGASATPAGTLTVTTPDATVGFVCASTFLFNAVGQTVNFMWTGTAWRAQSVLRAGFSAAVVGTTVLSGINLNHFTLSVTGTVSSTTTKGIPNGSAVGEVCQVGVSTAATTPVGTISLVGFSTLGAAATTLGTVGATANYAALTWSGTGWLLTGNSTLVLS